MQKVYKYGNAEVYIDMSKMDHEQIRNATEAFLRKVVKEKQYGNSNTTRDIYKK